MDGVDVSEVMISEREIKAMVEHTASLINKDYGDEEDILRCLLRSTSCRYQATRVRLPQVF